MCTAVFELIEGVTSSPGSVERQLFFGVGEPWRDLA